MAKFLHNLQAKL
jgi:hypothetical protein